MCLCVFFVVFRFRNGYIYTYIGEVCVSVNPYKTMNIYDSTYVEKYKGENIFFTPHPSDFRTYIPNNNLERAQQNAILLITSKTAR